MSEKRPAASSSALVLCPEAPYPMTGGGCLRTASIIEYLAARTRALDVIVFREPETPDPVSAFPRGLARSVEVITLPRHARNTVARAGRNLGRLIRGAPPLMDRFAGFDEEVRRAVAGRRFDLAVIEHFWAAMYRDALASVAGRVVLNLHNVESAWHAAMAAIAPEPKAAILRRFARASERMERSLLPQFDALLVTSEADAARVRALAPRTRVAVYPNAIPETPLPRSGDAAAQRPALIFSGNLEYRPNQHGLRFFLDQVWPRLRSRFPEWEFRVAGKNVHAVRDVLANRSGVTHVEIGSDPIGVLAQALIAVVPLFAASGTRIKIIEAWAAGVPVVSTPTGAEGLPVRDGENMIIAAGGEEFSRAIVGLMADRGARERIAAAGRATYERDFTWQRAWQALETTGVLGV